MSQGYHLVKPKREKDFDDLFGVMKAAFKGEDVATIVRRFAEFHPKMSLGDYFIIKDGEEAVAGLLLIPQTWKIDGVEYNVAEMGCVGTIPEYRGKGLQRVLNDEFDKYAKEKGYDLCALAGIPYFYRQFGYQYAVELDYVTEIAIKKIPEVKSDLVVKQFGEKDFTEAQILLEKNQSRYFVHSVRTLHIWKMQQETGTYGAEPFKAKSIYHENELVAYFRFWTSKNDNIFHVRELAIKSESYLQKVASIIRKQAEEDGLEKIKTKLSHEDLFSKYLIKLGAEKNKPYAWQVKILDTCRFLEKLGPAIETRLEKSEFKGLTKKLVMNFWKYSIELFFESGKLISVKYVSNSGRSLGFNPDASVQLFFGYRSLKDLEYAYPDFYVKGGLSDLINVIFPRQPGYIHYCY